MSLVIIDDNDSSVQYNTPGGWRETGTAHQFNGTTHASAKQGDTATLVFEGMLISVYGTVAPSSGQSRLNFSIDGTDVGFYQAPEGPGVNNSLLWTSPSLEDASHKLTITVDQDASLSQQVNPLNRTFFLDYFIYQTTSTAGQTMVIDDNDPRVAYSPKWNPDHSDARLESTRHVSNSLLDGAWAAVSFNGTGISLFGSLPKDQEFNASVAIDGSQVGTISDNQTSQTPLFDSGALPAGPHTINVTTVDGYSLTIDYFLVENDLQSPSVGPTTSGSGSACKGTLSPSGTAQGSKTPPITAIVGGAVGGLVILALVLILVLIRRRRARTHRNHAAIISVLARWIGNNEELTTVPRPFQPSLHEEAELAPPPYRLKDSPVVGQ